MLPRVRMILKTLLKTQKFSNNLLYFIPYVNKL